MEGQPHHSHTARAWVLRALLVVAFTVFSAAAAILIGNKIRATWGVMEMLERQVDGMIAATSAPGTSRTPTLG